MSNPYLGLTVGLSLFLSPGVNSPKHYRTVVRGWEDKRRIWLDAAPGEEKLPLTLMGRAAIFRFLQEGEASAFHAHVDQVVGVDGTRASGLVISWPDTVETVGIRKHPRIRAQYPCSVTIAQKTIQAEIRDLSEGGCSIQLEGKVSASLETELSVSFQLPGAASINEIPAWVVSATRKDTGWLIGCKFGDLDEIATTNIRMAITDVLAAMRGDTVKRIVILGPNDTNVRALVTALREANYEVFVAEYMLNALYWLGGQKVTALLIVDQPLEVSADVVCRILRITPSTESVPIYLIGEYDQPTHQKLSKMPLTQVHSFDALDTLLNRIETQSTAQK
ncbi:MAG: PilZ domain-containing protein [Candidatus Hydrogenedentes bacterium]|nr:PilZ domain-containing protein [Candidatus Hydrogenedentota bacterium]